MSDKDFNNKEDSGSSSIAGISRRGLTASILGLGGLSLLSNTAKAQSHQTRRWNQDVDAQGHRLMGLGGLDLQGTSEEVRNLAGQGLRIEDGTLHGDSASVWEDTNNDGQLEVPNHDGINVGRATTQTFTQTTNEGEGTERVLLDSFEDNDESSEFNYSTGELPDYDIYEFKYIVRGVSSTDQLHMRIEGDDSGVYSTRYSDNNVQKGSNRWEIANIENETITHGEVTMRGGDYSLADEPGFVYADFKGGGGLQTSRDTPIEGVYEKRIENVTQFRVFTRPNNPNAVGKVALWGQNLTL